MSKPLFLPVEKKMAGLPVLIVDKKGIIGKALLEQMLSHTPVVFVGSHLEKRADNFLAITYRRKTPAIPLVPYKDIIIVDDGEKEIKETLPQFIEHAKTSSARVFFVTGQIFTPRGTSYPSEKFIRVVLGDLFGCDTLLLYQEGAVNALLRGVLEKGMVRVSGMGLEKIHPVFLEDAVDELTRLMFNGKVEPNTYNLFSKNPTTLLSVARLIKKHNPAIGIDFVNERKKKREQINHLSQQGAFLLPDSYSAQKGIAKTLAFLKENEAVMKESKTATLDALVAEQKRFYAIGYYVLYFLISLFFVPIVVAFLSFGLGAYELQVAKKQIEEGAFLSAKRNAEVSQVAFAVATRTAPVVAKQALLIGRKETAAFYTRSAVTGEKFSLATISLLSSFENFLSVAEGKSIRPGDDFAKAYQAFKEAIVTLQKAQVELTESSVFTNVPTANLSAFVDVASSTIDVIPSLLGIEGSRAYLVLFQNNMELRPAGGFIGSYGIATVRDGKVTDFSVHDVYDADGQLKGHVEPPFPLRRYLGVPHWYLRDSNFDLDFQKSASTAAFFLQSEIGTKVDGVIAVDISFVKSIIALVGSVRVPDYNEIVTADNLYSVTQAHAEKNFFPGSTQKKDFLRSLFSALQSTIAQKKNIQYLSFAENAYKAILEKHLLFAHSDQSIQKVFSITGLTPALEENQRTTGNLITDFLSINEANVGVNKANYYIRRKITQDLVIDEKGSMSATLTIDYKNIAKKEQRSVKTYNNYLRVVLPLGTRITAIAIDGKNQKIVPAVLDPLIYESKTFLPPDGLEVEEKEQDKKAVFGFPVVIPEEAFKKVTIAYLLPYRFPVEQEKGEYTLRFFKQPGVDEYPFFFSLTYPSFLTIQSSSKGLLSNKDGKLMLSSVFTTDRTITASFTRHDR